MNKETRRKAEQAIENCNFCGHEMKRAQPTQQGAVIESYCPACGSVGYVKPDEAGEYIQCWLFPEELRKESKPIRKGWNVAHRLIEGYTLEQMRSLIRECEAETGERCDYARQVCNEVLTGRGEAQEF